MRELEGTVMSATSSGARLLAEAFVAHSLRTKAAHTLQDQTDQSVSESEADESVDEEKADLSHLPTMGVLITTRPLSEGIEKAMANSRRPLMYMCLEELPVAGENHNGSEEESGEGLADVPKVLVRQMAWNKAASRDGLEGYGIVRKYADERVDSDSNRSEQDGEASLVFQGQPLQFPSAT